LAAHVNTLGTWYNNAAAIVERNAHGYTVLTLLRQSSRLMLLVGLDGRAGWQTTERSKHMLYDGCAEALRDVKTTIRCAQTYSQLASIEGATLKAPEGLPDDLAMAYALALSACFKNPLFRHQIEPTEVSWPIMLTPGRGMDPNA